MSNPSICAPADAGDVVPIQVNFTPPAARPAPPRRRSKYELRELRDPASGEIVWVSYGPRSRESKDEKRSASEACSAWWREQIRAKRHKQRPLKGAFQRLSKCSNDGLDCGGRYPAYYTRQNPTIRHQYITGCTCEDCVNVLLLPADNFWKGLELGRPSKHPTAVMQTVTAREVAFHSHAEIAETCDAVLLVEGEVDA